MSIASKAALFVSMLLVLGLSSNAQTEYQVVHLTQSGNISGTVKWSGPMPHLASFPITKDPQCATRIRIREKIWNGLSSGRRVGSRIQSFT